MRIHKSARLQSIRADSDWPNLTSGTKPNPIKKILTAPLQISKTSINQSTFWLAQPNLRYEAQPNQEDSDCTFTNQQEFNQSEQILTGLTQPQVRNPTQSRRFWLHLHKSARLQLIRADSDWPNPTSGTKPNPIKKILTAPLQISKNSINQSRFWLAKPTLRYEAQPNQEDSDCAFTNQQEFNQSKQILTGLTQPQVRNQTQSRRFWLRLHKSGRIQSIISRFWLACQAQVRNPTQSRRFWLA